MSALFSPSAFISSLPKLREGERYRQFCPSFPSLRDIAFPTRAETHLEGGATHLQHLPKVMGLGSPTSLQGLQRISKASKPWLAKGFLPQNEGDHWYPSLWQQNANGKLPGSAPALAQPEPAWPLTPVLPANGSCPITHPQILPATAPSTTRSIPTGQRHSGTHPDTFGPAGICLGKDTPIPQVQIWGPIPTSRRGDPCPRSTKQPLCLAAATFWGCSAPARSRGGW